MKITNALHTTAIFLALGCGHADDGHDHGNEEEVISTVTLTFTPESGAAIVATFNDADGDGGEAPTIDDIALPPGSYEVEVGFENRIESPPEIITNEVADEAEAHLVFFTGTAVDGPATDNSGAPLLHSYADQDLNGLPLGLTNAIVASAGEGELTITLRHMPPLGDALLKSDSVLAAVRSGGFAAIGGTSDTQVTFSVLVE